MINCLATLRQIDYFADVNANDNLRKIVRCLPDHLIERWKNVATDIRERSEIPQLEHICNFVRKRVKAEFDPDFGDVLKMDTSRNTGFRREDRRGIHSNTKAPRKPPKCYICQAEHRVHDCPTMADSSPEERIQHAKNLRLCFSCLVRGHPTRECRSRNKCGKNGCIRIHHPLLHTDPPTNSGVASVLDKGSIMPVVRVQFKAANGKVREGNVLVDSGAGTTVIRKDFAKALGLQGRNERIDLAVVGGERVQQKTSRRLKFWISPLDKEEEFTIEAHEIDKTILNVPALDRPWLKSFSHLRDAEFPHKAGPIDLISGVQYSHLHAEEEVRQGLPFQPVGKRTRLGWHVIGSDSSKGTTQICSISFVQKLNMERFYEFETLGVQARDCSCPKTVMSTEDRMAMDSFEASCTNEANRYVIGLPWKKDPRLLPNNYPLAERRLESLERSLSKNEEKAKMYNRAIEEYIENGWARPLTKEESQSNVKPVYYLPHHGVYRPDKPSTPLRVVFDPASQYQGASLNSFLCKGPCLIGNLLGVLLRFREDLVGFAGDISKMYLQILLPERDTHVHRFLWRNLQTKKQPTEYLLSRVTFGDKPSPDMASYVMLKIAKEIESEYPDAAVILRRDRYMDDLIHSCPTPQIAASRMTALDKALAQGSFKIKEWYYSSQPERDEKRDSNPAKPVMPEDRVGKATPSCMAPPATDINLDGERGQIKTLGIGWNPQTDTVNFTVKDLQISGAFTKRSVLSKISQIYDPLGLASAVTIKARVALQDIWRSKQFDWDDPLPEEIKDLWRNLFEDIEKLKGVKFPRCLKPSITSGPSQLHVFADASISAYGAVAYLLWPTPDVPEVRLISAKARVAPLRQSTIPRLELMAALLASRLAKTIYEEFKEKPASVELWSDSKVVLHWLRSDSSLMKAFVGVRIAEIQSTWNEEHWRYVPTDLNPADDLSRGLHTEELDGRWMKGPAFLKKPKEEWPAEKLDTPMASDPEMKNAKHKPVGAVVQNQDILKSSTFSSWQRLLRVTAYCMRFLSNAKKKARYQASSNEVREGPLVPEEMDQAERYWIMSAQRDLEDWQTQFSDLAPFVKEGVVRVGGRLKHAPLTYEEIHPILLPASHPISKLIMREVHTQVSHGGPERTLSESRRKFWITRGRNLAKGVVKNCTICRKLRQPPHSTLMADLPPERLKPFSPPFSVTGVDLFGPFNLKTGRNRTKKAWGALFTCATVRAIHLEIVKDLSTQSFMHALRRFVVHHGWPHTMISDNGKSFVGTEKELKKLVQEGRNRIEEFSVLHRIRWIFTTPLSPHQGGIYESLIKQTKRALKAIVGSHSLSWNEMSTIFAEVECLINSRPLGYPSNDPNDPQPLTPNHIILGRATATVPQGPYQETRNLRKRFEFVQMLLNHFWKRFVREYLPTLMRRAKWQLKTRQLQVGDVVLLVDYNAPRGKWDLARVTDVFPGPDGVVRNVQVKTSKG